MPDGQFLPNHWSNNFPPVGQAQATRHLHYDSLYVADASVVGPNQTFAWYRFFPGGQYTSGGRWPKNAVEGPPTARDGDDFAHGFTGRYSVVGDHVVMETIDFTDSTFGGFRFLRQGADIMKDGSLALLVPRRGRFLLTKDDYDRHVHRRVPMPDMKRQADWPVK